ncbi:MAG: hypothetical protein KKB20_15870 [Proteobacteria bacterium]|nr:hypothetical protein [Pseudomonadota bacterium]
MDEKEIACYLAQWDGKLGADRNPANYQRRDDGSHIFENAESYYEWWYFDASFTNNYHIVLTWHYRNVFLRPMVPSIQLFIYQPDGTKVERMTLAAPDQISAFPDYCDVKMGKSWVRDMGDRYELYMKIKGVGARLTFRNVVPPWKPGQGFNYKDEDNGRIAGWVVPVPQARVEGDLYLDGQTMPVEGSGYHDHNWGNFPYYEITRGWYWGRVHNDKFTVDYGWVLPRLDEAPVLGALLVASHKEILLSTNMLRCDLQEMKKDEEFGTECAHRLVMSAEALGVKFQMTIDSRSMVEKMQLPNVTDWNHYYYRYLADYDMRVEVDGAADGAQGEMLHEVMFL